VAGMDPGRVVSDGHGQRPRPLREGCTPGARRGAPAVNRNEFAVQRQKQAAQRGCGLKPPMSCQPLPGTGHGRGGVKPFTAQAARNGHSLAGFLCQLAARAARFQQSDPGLARIHTSARSKRDRLKSVERGYPSPASKTSSDHIDRRVGCEEGIWRVFRELATGWGESAGLPSVPRRVSVRPARRTGRSGSAAGSPRR
jgi:hypothetical protein